MLMTMAGRRGLPAAGTALLAAPALAQDAWPSGPIRFIVGFAAGSNPDLMARLMAEPLSAALGVPVVVENRPGAAGSIGAEAAARARPDGNTLLLGTVNHAINQSLQSGLSFDFLRDFVPIGQCYLIPNVVLVATSLPVSTMAELVALARARPGQINFASSGVGTSLHLAGELLKQSAGIDMVHVPYRGAPDAHQDLEAGRVQLIIDNLPPSIPRIEGGRAKPLAITSPTRFSRLPDVPTVAEAGFPQLQMLIWGGIFVATRTPAPIQERLRVEMDRMIETPAFQARLQQLGSLPVERNREAFRAFTVAETARWREVVERSGARAS